FFWSGEIDLPVSRVEITTDNNGFIGCELAHGMVVEHFVKIEFEFQAVRIGGAIRIVDVVEDIPFKLENQGPSWRV
ncbi:MAG: hypothetical protein H6Q62_429, partial [Firmicutes bacterium]|nr:hypothetical protein [Bacillota bacterium]